MGMEIDSLEIAIQAQAKAAASEIDGLYQKLGNVATALNRTSTGYRSAAREAGRLSAAFKSIASIRIPDFSNLITQLTTLSKINLSGLANKKINIDIGVNAPKSASQVQWAIEKAADGAKIDSSKIADQLISEYALKGKAKSAMRAAVDEMTAELAKGFDGNSFSNNIDVFIEYSEKIKNIIRESGSVLSSQVGDEERILDAFAGKTSFIVDRVGEDIDKIRSKVSDINNDRVAGAAENMMSGSFQTAIDGAMNSIRGGFENAMKVASHELTLDVQVNQDKIVRDIQNAILKAAKVDYTPVEVKLQVNKQGITDSVTKELQGISAGNLPQISEAYERLFQSLMNVHTVLGNSSPINSVVNALARLTAIDLRKFDTDRFKEITSTISSLSSMGDASAGIAKMVSALARLANVGDVMNTTAQAIPGLGNSLRAAFDAIGSANIDAVTERVLNAFTRLATSGEKAAKAAANLPGVSAVIRDFFEQMAQAPAINDTTLRMVESFTALATTGRRIGSIGGQVSKSLSTVNDTGDRTAKTFQNIGSHSNKVLDAFKKLISACGSLAKGIGSGASKIVTGFKSIGNGSNHIQKATLSLKNLLQVALGFYGIRTLFNWGKDAIEFASDLTEVQNVVENSFGTEGTKAIEGYAATARETLGMSELTFKQIASRYQAMGNAMGITTGQIAKANANVTDKMIESYANVGDGMGNMSTRLTMLAADMASFYNVEQETVAEALNAVYTGQTRPLRQYGLDLTQATLQEWANKQGIDAKISSMSQAEKTMLRYQYVIAQTTTIQGDFYRTSETWANQIRLLKQNLQALGGVIGGTLINAFRPLISWLNKAMGSVIAFAETVGNALGKIFGWQILHTPASNAADAYDTLAEGLDNAGTSGGDAADGIGKATKAAEEYKNTVLGFDELNKLNDVSETTGGSGGSGGGAGGGAGGVAGIGDGTGADFKIVKGEPWWEEYKSDINTLFELGSYISDTLTKAMESIKWDEIYGKARDFGTGLASFLNGLIKPELFSALAGTIAGAINTVLNAADAFLDRFNFDNLGRSIAAGINRFFRDFDFGLAASVFYKSINGLADTIIAAGQDIEWGSIGTKISTGIRTALGGIEWEEKVYPAASTLGEGLAKFLNGLINPETFRTVGEAVAGALNTALHILDDFGDTFDFANFGQSIAAAIRGFFNKWDAGLTADTFNKLAEGALTTISEAIGGVNWKRVGAKIAGMLSNIEWDKLLTQVGDVIMKAINAALDVATGIFDGTPVTNAIESLREKVNSIADKIDFPNISKGIKDIVEALSPAVSGFAQGFIDVFGSLGELGAETISNIGKALQKIADALNSVDPAILESIGSMLGKVAAALLGIMFANKGVTTIQNLIGSLTGTGTADTIVEVGEGIVMVKKSAKTATKPVSKFLTTVITKAHPVGIAAGILLSFAQSIDTARFHAAGGKGSVTDFYQVVEGLGGYLSGDLTSKLQEMAIEFANNGTSSEEASKKLAQFFTDENIDPATIELALANVEEALGYANPAIDMVRESFGLMGDEAVKSAQKAKMTDGDYNGLRTSLIDLAAQFGLSTEEQEMFNNVLERAKQSSSSTEAAYKSVRDELVRMYGEGSEKVAAFDKAVQEHAPNAFGEIEEGAKKADKKTGSLWSAIGTFAGGSLAQSLLMAVLGGAFATMGTKADEAKTPIDNLKTKIGNFVTKIGEYATTVKTNGENIGSNATQGAIDGVEANEKALNDAYAWTMVEGPFSTIEKLAGIQSPSTVTYGYGENIVYGMQNALNEKGKLLVGEITAIMTNMLSNITGKFNDFKTAGHNLAQQIKTGFGEIRFNDLTDTIWDSIDFSTLNKNMKTAGENAMTKFANGMYNTYVKTPHLTFTTTVSGQGDSKTTSWNSSVSWYENGGIPNTGELFYARENGRPELVGSIGNRSAVANNDQIVVAVSKGVESAVSRALGNSSFTGGTAPVNEVVIKADSEILYRIVKRGERRASGRYGTVVAIG